MSKVYEGKVEIACKCSKDIEVDHRVYTETSNISDINRTVNYFYVCTKCGNEVKD